MNEPGSIDPAVAARKVQAERYDGAALEYERGGYSAPPIGTKPGSAWREVMARAGYQCECRGACGSGHSGKRGVQQRCTAIDRLPRLIVGPTDPTIPDDKAWRVGRGELSAWCPTCQTGARRLAGKAAGS